MVQLSFILVISFGSIVVGYAVQRMLVPNRLVSRAKLTRLSSRMKLFALIVLQPIAILNAFWRVQFADMELLALPFLGALSLVVGGVGAVIGIHYLRIPPFRAGSVFTTGMFTNIGVFAALFSFVLYGPLGFSLVQLFRVFEETIYYAIGFPLAQQIGTKPLNRIRLNIRLFAIKPIAVAPLGAIVLGRALQWLGLPPPDPLAVAGEIVVPAMTAILGFAIGLTLRVTGMAVYRREVLLVMAVKFVLTPTVIILSAYVLGLGNVAGGIPLRVVAIASCMPSAFLALVPPAIYGFDLDLANSAWLATTGALLVIVPLLFLVLA